MRFGVLGTGFWAKEVHAAALAAHPTAELVGVWGRDLAKAKAVGAEFDVAGLRRRRRAAGRRWTPSRSPCRRDVQAPLAERAAAAGKHLLLEKPIALDVAGADRLVDAVQRRRGRLGRVLHVPVPAGDVVLAEAGRPDDAGRRARVLAGVARAGSPVRRLALAQGARRALGHRPARAVGARAGARAGRLGAGRRRACGTPSTWCFGHESASPRRSRSRTPWRRFGRGRVLRARRRRPAGAAAARRAPRPRPTRWRSTS